MPYVPKRNRRRVTPPFPTLESVVPFTVNNSAGGNYVLINFGQAVNVTAQPSLIWLNGAGVARTVTGYVVNSPTQVRLNFATAVADEPGFMQLTPNQPQIRSNTGGYVDPAMKFVPVEA